MIDQDVVLRHPSATQSKLSVRRIAALFFASCAGEYLLTRGVLLKADVVGRSTRYELNDAALDTGSGGCQPQTRH